MEILNLILHSFCASIMIMFIHACFGEGMILHFLTEPIEKLLGPFWSKPIFACQVCMTSVWGTALFFMFYAPTMTEFPIRYFVLYFLLTGGMNVALSTLQGFIHDYFDREQLKEIQSELKEFLKEWKN